MIDYTKDPIFKNYNILWKIKSYADQRNVGFFNIDRMSVDHWILNGCPPAVTNSIILREIPNKDSLIKMPDSWCGVYYHEYPIGDSIVPSKSYNCFINRMDVVRQTWLYQLIRRGIFEKGYVSFNMDTREYNGTDPHAVFQDQFERHCGIFLAEHEFIRSQVPYRNFPESGELTTTCYDSKISLVLETYFDQNEVITYSEKTFRALQIPRPWLLFSHKHAIKHLRKIGFDTLDDVIDHDQYDHSDFAIERQIKLLDMMVDLIDLDFDQDRLDRAALHNQRLLEKFSLTWFDDYMHSIEKAAVLDD